MLVGLVGPALKKTLQLSVVPRLRGFDNKNAKSGISYNSDLAIAGKTACSTKAGTKKKQFSLSLSP